MSIRGDLRLEDAIEQLYGVFKRYGAENMTGTCDGGYEEEARFLGATRIERLQPGDLSRFAFRALTTWGSFDEFKHFLPRLLEIAATLPVVERGVWTDFEILMGKLAYGEWEKWPRRERDAVREYLHSLWAELLIRFPFQIDVDRCLCGIARAEEDVSHYLDAWDEARTVVALRHFSEFLDDNVFTLLRNERLANAYWDDRDEQVRQVVRWLVDPAAIASRQQMLVDILSPVDGEVASRCFDQLQTIKERFCT